MIKYNVAIYGNAASGKTAYINALKLYSTNLVVFLSGTNPDNAEFSVTFPTNIGDVIITFRKITEMKDLTNDYHGIVAMYGKDKYESWQKKREYAILSEKLSSLKKNGTQSIKVWPFYDCKEDKNIYDSMPTPAKWNFYPVSNIDGDGVMDSLSVLIRDMLWQNFEYTMLTEQEESDGGTKSQGSYDDMPDLIPDDSADEQEIQQPVCNVDEKESDSDSEPEIEVKGTFIQSVAIESESDVSDIDSVTRKKITTQLFNDESEDDIYHILDSDDETDEEETNVHSVLIKTD